MLSDSRLRMSFEVKKKNTFFDEFSIYKPHNQSTVETVTAISNMFIKLKSEIRHMYTKGVVVIKIFFFFGLMDYDPDNTIEVISSRSMSLLELFLGMRRPPKIKSTVYQYIRPS